MWCEAKNVLENDRFSGYVRYLKAPAINFPVSAYEMMSIYQSSWSPDTIAIYNT